jgi:hypothetical protein
MQQMKIIKIFFFPFVSLMFSLFVAIPELSRDITEFHKSVETFESSKIVKVKMLIRADKDYLIINTKEGNEFEVGRTYSKYFEKLNSKSNIGKKITFYTISETNKYPNRIEIENEIIYDTEIGNFWYYLILIATLILTYFSIEEYRKIKKTSR